MPIFSQYKVDDDQIQNDNSLALPDWRRFHFIGYSDLVQHHGWARVKPFPFNAQVAGMALAIFDRFEVTQEKQDLLVTCVQNKDNGWLIKPDESIHQFRDGKVGDPQRNPALSLYQWHRTQNDKAWKSFNATLDYTQQQWRDEHPELKMYLDYSFDMPFMDLANPISLAVEMIADKGACMYLKNPTPKYQRFLIETTLRGYRLQLNLIDSDSWL